MFSLLRDRRILILWIGESINTFGNGLTFIALAWFLYRLYPHSPGSRARSSARGPWRCCSAP